MVFRTPGGARTLLIQRAGSSVPTNVCHLTSPPTLLSRCRVVPPARQLAHLYVTFVSRRCIPGSGNLDALPGWQHPVRMPLTGADILLQPAMTSIRFHAFRLFLSDRSLANGLCLS